ncbi:MAG: hypothetical protein GC178_16605 [Flavobacteriales bacterium]|nr:hypothetical protein [Flavobacteriales bacterium]
MVTPFTGDFHYSVPLMQVPGPCGEVFPLALTYQGGVRVDQEASWVGLGWNLNIGEVSRNMLGVPDDYRGGRVVDFEFYGQGGNVTTTFNIDIRQFFGPVHYKDLYDFSLDYGYERAMDLYSSKHGASEDEAPFEFPDYDDYYVSGPGIGGVMQPYMFDYANLFREDVANEISYGDPTGTATVYQKFTKSPEFRFKDESGAQIRAPYYSIENQWGSEDIYGLPTSLNPQVLLSNPYTQRQQGSQSTSTNYYSNCQADQFTLWAANHIKYYTNKEIDDGVSGFLEFDYSIDRGSSSFADFEEYGIGGFQITNTAGVTYHYSLPIYANYMRTSDFLLDDDNVTPITDDFNNPVQIHEKNDRYATAWKLTAITGQDYEDANSNGVADEGDNGYWMAVDYRKWTDGFEWRSPYYGYNFDQRVKKNLNYWSEENYQPHGTVSEGEGQVYYPVRIRTASHSAYFVYDERLDAHSVADGNIIPQLAVTRVVLVNNEYDPFEADLDAFDALTSTDFTLGSEVNKQLFVSEDHYQNNQSDIESVSLRTVELTYDNSLALGLYNNIKSNHSLGSDVKIANGNGMASSQQNFLYTPISSYDSNLDDNSGKLTLKKVKFYEDQHVSIVPSNKFDYSSGTHNPNYHHEQQDFFGFFKKNYDSSARGGYITDYLDEDAHVDAWSLNKITTPLGGEINVTYESDTYNEVCYDGGIQPIRLQPKRIFRIKDVYRASLGSDWKIELYDPDGYRYFGNTDVVSRWGLGFDVECTYAPNYWTQNGCNVVLDQDDLPDLEFVASPPNNDYFKTPTIQLCDCYEAIYGLNGNGGLDGWGYLQYRLKEAFGGGVRVKSISITEPDLDQTYSLEYSYQNGVLTTEPDRFSGLNLAGYSPQLLLSNSGSDRHARPPMVGYDQVDYVIKGANDEVLGRSGFAFHNYYNDLRPNHTSKKVVSELSDFNSWQYNHILVRDYSLAGRIKEQYQFDADDVLVSRTKYEYSDLALDDDHGITEEVFYIMKMALPESNNNWSESNVLRKQKINRYLKRKIIYQDDRILSTLVSERDPLTGIAIKTSSSSYSDGTEVAKSDLAYENESAMGSKYLSSSNKNLVSQVETITTYDEEEDVANLRDGTTTSWNSSFDLWDWYGTSDVYKRFSSGYSKYLAENSKVYNGEVDPADWKLIGTTTMVDGNGRVIERSDAMGRYSSVKFGYNDRLMIAKAVNSPYQGFTHTSFEVDVRPEPTIYYAEGEVLKRDGVSIALSSGAHSGDYVLQLESLNGPLFRIGLDGERGIQPGRTYFASVWVRLSNSRLASITMELDGSWSGGHLITVSKNKTEEGLIVGDWKRLEIQLTVPDDYVNTGGTNGNNDLRVYLSGSGYFDDFRVCPLDAKMEGMVYDNRTGRLMYALDNDNIATKYEYDAAGQLVKLFRETEDGLVKRVETAQHFGRSD